LSFTGSRRGDAHQQPHHQPADGTGSSNVSEHQLKEMMLALMTELESAESSLAETTFSKNA